MQRKLKFDATYINSTVDKFHSIIGDNSIIAQGDGSFPFTMKGMDGGGYAHKRLVMLIQHIKVVLLTSD